MNESPKNPNPPFKKSNFLSLQCRLRECTKSALTLKTSMSDFADVLHRDVLAEKVHNRKRAASCRLLLMDHTMGAACKLGQNQVSGILEKGEHKTKKKLILFLTNHLFKGLHNLLSIIH